MFYLLICPRKPSCLISLVLPFQQHGALKTPQKHYWWGLSLCCSPRQRQEIQVLPDGPQVDPASQLCLRSCFGTTGFIQGNISASKEPTPPCGSQVR